MLYLYLTAIIVLLLVQIENAKKQTGVVVVDYAKLRKEWLKFFAYFFAGATLITALIVVICTISW